MKHRPLVCALQTTSCLYPFAQNFCYTVATLNICSAANSMSYRLAGFHFIQLPKFILECPVSEFYTQQSES